MNNQRLQVIGFFTLLAFAMLIVLFMWWPFLKLLALAVILSVLFLPVYKRILGKTKSEAWSAIGTIVLILFIVLVPLFILGQLVFNEVYGLYGELRNGAVTFDRTQIINSLPPQLQMVAQNINQDLGNRISEIASRTVQSIEGIVSSAAGFFLSFFLVFFSTYYLLRDGGKMKKYFASIFPLSERHENVIIEKLERAISGVVKGSFLVALSQGAVATIGFLIFGVPQPFLWGAFTVLAALVPTVGTSLSLIPAVAYLLITGSTGAGIGMAIWGVLAVGLIDNVISPKLVGSQTQLHPLLVLFSVIGGLQLFGFIGFLLGPIIMAVFVTLLDIYRTDLKDSLER